MSTRQQVLALLRGPVVQRIRFTFPFFAGTVTIAGASFQRVARAIETGAMRLDVTNTFPAGVAGQYVSGTPNTLRVKPISGRAEEGMVLHECTHAVFDLTHTRVNANDDEAACYVVNALYFRMTGLRAHRWSGEPHATAGGVADALLREYAAGTRGIPAVNADAWNRLKATVMLHPVYNTPITHPAGFIGSVFLGGGEYPHDG